MKSLVLFCYLVMVLVSSCHSRRTGGDSGKPSGIEAREDDSIFMSVNQSWIDINRDTTITVVIHNNTNSTITTGLRYKIEFLNNDVWERCEYSATIVTHLILVSIEPQARKEFVIYLYPQYHQYESGKYRIVKYVDYGEEEIEVAAYFQIGLPCYFSPILHQMFPFGYYKSHRQ